MEILPHRPSLGALYSSPVGDLRALAAFVCPQVAYVPGGTIGALARGLAGAGFSLKLARSEVGAGFYALGMTHGSGRARPALVLTVGGGAAAALAQPLWCAHARRLPVIAITGEVRSDLAGRGAVQDGTGRDGPSLSELLRPVTCRSTAVSSADEAWREILTCLELSTTLHAPAHVSIPIDVQSQLLRVAAQSDANLVRQESGCRAAEGLAFPGAT